MQNISVIANLISLGIARGKLFKYCNAELSGEPLWQFLLSEVLLRHKTGSYIGFSSLLVDEQNFFGRSKVTVITPHLGVLAGIPCVRPEIGQFCTALAIDDLVDQLEMHSAGARHVLRSRQDVIGEIAALQQQDWNPVLVSSSRDKFLANAVKWG